MQLLIARCSNFSNPVATTAQVLVSWNFVKILRIVV